MINGKIKRIIQKYKSITLPIKATIWYTICNIVQKAISLLTTPLFTRILTVDEFGEYSIYQSWLSLLMIFTTLTLNGGVFSKAMVEFSDDRDRYISSMQGLVTVLCFGWLCLFLVMHKSWEAVLGLPFFVIFFMFFQMLAKVSFEFWGGKRRFEYNYVPYVCFVIVFSILNVALSLISVLYFSRKGLAKIYAEIFVTIGVFGIAYINNFKKGKSFYIKKYWKYALAFSLPMLPYYISQMIFNQSDRIMIGHLLGQSDAALYSLAVNCSLTMLFVLDAIESSYLPWLYTKLAIIKKSKIHTIINVIRNTENSLMILVGGLLIILMLFSPELVFLMGSDKYQTSIWVIPPVVGSLYFLFQTKLFVAVEFYYENKSALLWSSIISAGLNIILNYLLLPKLGFVVAGYTTLFSYIVFSLINYYSCNKIKIIGDNDVDARSLFDGRYILSSSIGFVFIILCMELLYKFPAIRYLLILTLLMLIVWNRRKIVMKMNNLIRLRNTE